MTRVHSFVGVMSRNLSMLLDAFHGCRGVIVGHLVNDALNLIEGLCENSKCSR